LAFGVLAGQTLADFAARNGLTGEVEGHPFAALRRLPDHHAAVTVGKGRRRVRVAQAPGGTTTQPGALQ
jgi:hypothetical protein